MGRPARLELASSGSQPLVLPIDYRQHGDSALHTTAEAWQLLVPNLSQAEDEGIEPSRVVRGTVFKTASLHRGHLPDYPEGDQGYGTV